MYKKNYEQPVLMKEYTITVRNQFLQSSPTIGITMGDYSNGNGLNDDSNSWE